MQGGNGGMTPGAGSMNGPRPWGTVPWRGPKMDRREGDGVEPMLVYDTRVQVFDLTDPVGLEKYQEVSNKIANGEYRMGREEIEFSKEKGTWLVMMRWYEMYYEAPKGARVAEEPQERKNGNDRRSW